MDLKKIIQLLPSGDMSLTEDACHPYKLPFTASHNGDNRSDCYLVDGRDNHFSYGYIYCFEECFIDFQR